MYEGLQPAHTLRFAGRCSWWRIGVIVLGGYGTALRRRSSAGSTESSSTACPWYVTRTTALLAYLAITGSVIYGLLLSTKILDRLTHRAVSFTFHQDLASIGLGARAGPRSRC